MFIVALIGCESLQYPDRYDTSTLEIGMSVEEVKDEWGEPDSSYISGEYIILTYKNTSGSNYDVYDLTFRNNKLEEWSIYDS